VFFFFVWRARAPPILGVGLRPYPPAFRKPKHSFEEKSIP
jgi:hypothetical protein